MNCKVISISDIERSHRGATIGDDLSVYHGRGEEDVFGLRTGIAFCFRAYSYLVVLHGEAVLSIDQRWYEAREGTLISQSPLHNVQFQRATNDFEFRVMAVTQKMIDSLPLVNLHPRILEGVRTHHRPVCDLTKDEATVINASLEDIAHQVERTGHRYRRELVENVIGRFFLEYDNALANKQNDDKTAVGSKRQQEIADKFIALVAENFLTHKDVSFYSEALNITPQYLNRVLRKQTGVRPSTFISEMTYAEARNMLARGDMNVQEVSERLGFADQSSFGKFFKRCSGMTASKFS